MSEIKRIEKSILELAILKPKDADVCPYSGETFWG